MAAEIIQIDTQSFTTQTYDGQDTNLLSSFDVNTSLSSSSYIEYFTYDNNQNILSTDYNFTQYTIQNDGQSAGNGGEVSEVILDPEQALLSEGFDQGEYITYFNFFNKQVGSALQQLYITEISSDRTEIRLDSTSLTNADIVEQTTKFIQERESSTYFLDFYLNFGDNQLAIANNVQLDNTDPNNPTVLIKLYEALSDQFDLNSTLWVVTSVEEPRAYKVTFEENPIVINDTVNIKGPNFNLDLKDRVNNSTVELSYIDLLTTTLTSSQNQLNSLLEEKGLDINIDYTNFSNYVHFSSAQTRLENFYYKIQLIEQYSSSISILNNTTNSSASISSSAAVYESKINNIITNFDGYEYYLYYESGSTAWPKTNSQKPYILALSNSPTVLTWIGSADETNAYYGGLLLSASLYDNDNVNNLFFTIPEYLREDSNNEQYVLFIDMVGQFYDNIWIYYKDVTQKYNTDNRLEYGISKDIVADAIRDFGIKLYQNNFSIQDLYTAFLGITPEGGLFPFPNITGSLPAPSGFEYINNEILASGTDYLPLDDVNKSLYKRIYHNLPYLLKTKGTLPGLRALITSYGIPDTILRINEFGGKDKVNSNDWDLWQDEYNYACQPGYGGYISSSWGVNSNWNSEDDVPSTLEFRFKSLGSPGDPNLYSQSLWHTNESTLLNLIYTGSGYSSGSYSGSIIDPYYQYATLVFSPDYINYPNSSASIYLPFFDNGWWSIMITRNKDDFGLYAGNKIYEGGENNTELGFYSSAFISEDSTAWSIASASIFGTSSQVDIGEFNGLYQEIRYYNTPLSESVFKDYIMNPYSIEGNSLNSSPNELIFRAPLGGELYTGSVSIHPKVTGSWISTQSFTSNSDFYYEGGVKFLPNIEYFFVDQPVAGIKNIISDKIRIEDNTLPSGNTLSQYRALSQQSNISQSYTPNINYLEVAFSPQNEINEDIMDQIGFFNIGEFIGDPRLRSSSAVTYPALDQLRNEYFEKYTKNYDLTDFIRLIKFFDNSLFKMVRDFVPARTSLAAGIVIKQNLLERNKYPQPQVSWEDLDISGTLKPTWNDYEPGTVENFSGGTGGSFERFNLATNTSQSWIENIQTISGSVIVIHNAQDEFYDGELSGSNIVVSNGTLNPAYPVSTKVFTYKQVYYYGVSPSEANTFENLFLNILTSPKNGEILFDSTRTGPFGLFDVFKHMKIAKVDCNGNDNSISLGQLDKIVINTPVSPFGNIWITYDVTVADEQPNYYLYSIVSAKWNSTPFLYVPSWFPNQVFDYTVESYITSSRALTNFFLPTLVNNNPIGGKIDSWDTAPLNPAPYGNYYFNTSSGYFTLENTPNTPLSITSSVSYTSTSSINLEIKLLRQGSYSTLAFTGAPGSLPGATVDVSCSYYGLQGDKVYVRAYTQTQSLFISQFVTKADLFVTQSRAVSASSCLPAVFVEPYIEIPNFYNSDENALINNVELIRQSTLYQDVDYTYGITTPVNFDTLISGSAIKATVPDSNYTTRRHIIPRYLGSRSTSQELNVWTPGDTGTYGKLPTIDSLKTFVAYSPGIGGWPPERMNASAIFVKYLIDQNGNVSIPNTTENSLFNTQQTFQTGERVKISTQTQAGGNSSDYRTIIRGGVRIEPILYTQYGQAPTASWNAIDFEDIDPSNASGAVGNYTALYYNNSGFNPPMGWSKYTLTGTSYGTPVLNNEYTVPSAVINDGVNLIVNGSSTALNSTSTAVGFRIVKERGGNKVYYPNSNGVFQTTSPSSPSVTFSTLSPQGFTIPVSDLAAGDVIYLEVYSSNNSLITFNTQLRIDQYPNSTTPVTPGTNSLWGFPDPINYPYIITSSNPTLSSLYDIQVKQTDVAGSGFNPVTLQWSLKYGDEFRFEGREDFVFEVGKAYGADEGVGERLFPTGSIEVHFSAPLPVSSSLSTPSTCNLDNFVIRRYIDDASQILIEGFKPNGTTGPYIITPEYVTLSLDKNVDSFITDLAQKGLI